VLIVDDNIAAADTLAKLLRYYGHTVHVVYSGERALQDLACTAPELILLDLGMPGMDGYAVAREVRRRGWTGKIVAISGFGQDVDRARSKEAGFDEHLLKPVLTDDIVRILERMKTPEHKEGNIEELAMVGNK
jgi:CheY-like chemotaxis protein